MAADVDDPPPRPGRSIGIDLGTTNSAVAAVRDGKPFVIPNAQGKLTTPSVVAYRTDAEGRLEVLVGDEAVAQADANLANTFASVKRVIGRRRSEVPRAAASPALHAALDDAGPDGALRLRCPAAGRALLPQEVSAELLRRLVSDAEAALGEPVARAVITVPAYFTEAQRAATEAAGRLAGLDRVRLLREPEAAALAYGLDRREDELILVFDLGGGTFDVSVLEVGGGIIEVVWTGGDNQLGGDDFDRSIAGLLAGRFAAAESAPGARVEAGAVTGDAAAMARLTAAARAAKVRLSSAAAADVAVPALAAGGRDLAARLTLRDMEVACAPLLERLALPVRQVALMAQV